MTQVPSYIAAWFEARGWQMQPHQYAMFDAYAQNHHALVVAPTGSGKTLAGFLPALDAIAQSQPVGLHTLYISPLKALTHDMQRNLMDPIASLKIPARVESRTGDTKPYQRQRQRRKPPQVLLITPESLWLMLSYPEAPQYFASLQTIIIDELHQYQGSKRGDMLALALAQLSLIAPDARRVGLSATVADVKALCRWLGCGDASDVRLITTAGQSAPIVEVLRTAALIPYSGHMAQYAVPEIMALISKFRSTVVFVNTRAQAELMFQLLWEANIQGLPIGLYHSALNPGQRAKTLDSLSAGAMRAVVSTSALELGMDWGDVDCVIQVGAPKGVSRLLQRIGRSNHRPDAASCAYLVPSNRFEELECLSAITAIARGQRDGETAQAGAADVAIQCIMNMACSQPISVADVYAIMQRTAAFAHYTVEDVAGWLRFVTDGGYALQSYERFARLRVDEHGMYHPANAQVVRRHRQNIGVIVEAGKLKVRKLHGRGGKYLGEVEEYFAQQLQPGDSFYFAGEVLAFVAIRGMILEARATQAKEARIPSYAGGQMPLSTHLAEGVRQLLAAPDAIEGISDDTRRWLRMQQQVSQLPEVNSVLVESLPWRGLHYTIIYGFEGRRAHHTLAMLITRRMDRAGLGVVSFTVNDYALAIASVKPATADALQQMLRADLLGEELSEWMQGTSLMKRAFRHVATVTGLIEQQHAQQRKTMKQVTFSTDLIYDVLCRYDPEHVLLEITRAEAARELLDTERMAQWLIRYENSLRVVALTRPSPLSLSVLLEVRQERISGSAEAWLVAEAQQHQLAENLMKALPSHAA